MQLTGKNVLVTGGTGFLGSWLVEKTKESGVASGFAPGSSPYDFRDWSDTSDAFETHRPEVVFHLAAKCGGIGANMASPGEFIHDNLQMGINILEACRYFRVEKLIMVGTVCSYPKYTPAPFREGDLWNGYPEETNAPYGIAKKALLTLCQAYRQQYGLNAIYLIPANLYGPRDNFNPVTSHVIPAMIRRFIEAKERRDEHVMVWGDGTPTREFLYVEDCADALIAAAERYDGGDPVNLGTGAEISIGQLAYQVGGLCGYLDGKIRFDPSKPNGQPRRVLDTSRALELFGWQAKTRLTDGLKRTIEWYQANCAKMAA